jgi:hypothetical protein
MSKKLVFVLAAIFVLLVFSTTNASSTTMQGNRTPGVRVGDRAEYDWSSWIGNRLSLEVTDVQGSRVSYNITMYWRNGSVYWVSRYVEDFQLGVLGVKYLIPSGLSSGDSFLNRISNDTITIENTLTMVVAGSNRLVNYAGDVLLGNPDLTDQPVGINMYWDKQTGLLVESHISTMVGWEDITLKSWSISSGNSPSYDAESLLLVGGGVIFVVALVAAIGLATRRR